MEVVDQVGALSILKCQTFVNVIPRIPVPNPEIQAYSCMGFEEDNFEYGKASILCVKPQMIGDTIEK